MTDYVLLYSGGGTPSSKEEQAKAMQAWTDWFAQLGPAVKDGGNPFSGEAKAISGDGSIAELTGSGLTGYSVLTADSLGAAVDAAKSCPVLSDGGSIQVHETVSLM